MSDGRPDRPIACPSCQAVLGSRRWMWGYVTALRVDPRVTHGWCRGKPK